MNVVIFSELVPWFSETTDVIGRNWMGPLLSRLIIVEREDDVILNWLCSRVENYHGVVDAQPR